MRKFLPLSEKIILFLIIFLLGSTEELFSQKKDKVPGTPYVSRYYTYDDDGDGVPNYRDKCVATPKGEKVTPFGCPFDTDFDGVFDYEDKCITEKGPRSNKGCPVLDLDTDTDGVLDKDDLCPEVKGLKKNRGCPEIKEEDKMALKDAFDNLLFEMGKDIIHPSSYPALNKLSSVLMNNPKYKLLLEGHTDNVGEDQANYILSQNRALSVKKYLADKGIDDARVQAEWYGETKPKATNDTPDGRKLNRRVEMNIIY